MAVIYNTNYTHNPNSYLTLGIERAARRIFGADQIVVADNMTLAAIAASGEHNTLICIDGQRLKTQLMRRIRPAFRTMILWTFEDPFMRDFNVDNSSLFDFVFTNDPSCAEYYKGKGFYLPLAASRSIHERKIKATDDLDYDIFFAGTMWPNRVRTLRHVIAAFPEARLKLICPGNDYLPPLPADLAALAIQRPVSHEAFIDFANASAVTLTMFRDYASHGDVSQATAPGPRFYELALAGTAQVVEAPETMAATFFEDVTGAVLTRDIDGVVEAIGRFLSDRTARRKAAQSAQKAVLDRHLYENRLKQMAEVTGADFGRHVPGTAIAPRRRRLRVLMCTHSTIHEQAWGGVEVYQQTLCTLLGRDIEFFYWLRRGTHCRLTTAGGQELERYDVPEIGWMDAMCDDAEEMAFSNAISLYAIDIVHIQHLGHHALSLPIIAKACGTGVMFSAHDFWLVSARYNLLNHELRYVEEDVKWVLSSDVVLRAAENADYGSEQTRRAFIARMLRSVDTILFGTRHSQALIHEIYPGLESRRSLVLGIPSPENTVPVIPKPYVPLGEQPLRVAIVGNFLRTKGADTVLSLIDLAHPDHFEFHIFGYVHPEYDPVLSAQQRSNVKVYGRYTAGDIETLKIADVALNLSIWPETYCISLSEAWQNGLIPIVSDIGALGDRVTDGVDGFKVPVGSPAAVLERLELLRASETMRARMMANIGPHLWCDAKMYGAALQDAYRAIAPVRELGVAEMSIDAGQVHLLPHATWRHQAPPRHIFDPPTTRDLAVEMPEPVQNWVSIQGGECYIDEVSGFVLSADSVDKDFVASPSLRLRGWFFVPGVTTSGSLYVVLIGAAEASPVFIEAVRESRPDICSIFPDAPRRAGFSVEVALRGKWSEGAYRIGLVNVVNAAGAFTLTPVSISVDGGQIVAVARRGASNGQILADFNRIAHEDGVLRGVKLSGFPQAESLRLKDAQAAAYFIDDLGRPAGEDEAGDPGALYIRGWFFLPGADAAGTMYAVLVSETGEEAVVFGLHRDIREDVAKTQAGAPLMGGFSGWLMLRQGFARPLDGVYRICLANIIGQDVALRALNNTVEIADGLLRAIHFSDDAAALGCAEANAVRHLVPEIVPA
ncbi:glycosyltransferase family protein [Acidomonas methanolica]|uniref:Glycosyl transferase n=1 Tax=Acidomonas methanolica NBRC 104435 TaxID=1231351 RepID=A0A023D0H0_ACIMT|nr:glycosyltransferase [Acidomonas methanolica]TCS32254.1 glycosyltransferase involved in cell wall biosynthesis [Acidomonas methanolica]GAJ27627.1 glycosyl transferase [Acidomonas methanolica NBRC 104435]GBQ54385.1 glycosyltransferase [Acidomonas methanolica]GEK97689.1 hypothetical protein AME01nite_01880 [Acidomonas methanolica NBRC 104435]